MSDELIEAVEWSIELADVGYHICLSRLVDGVSTYTLTIDGVKGSSEYASHGEASGYAQGYRRRAKAQAAIAAVRAHDAAQGLVTVPREPTYTQLREAHLACDQADQDGPDQDGAIDPAELYRAMIAGAPKDTA